MNGGEAALKGRPKGRRVVGVGRREGCGAPGGSIEAWKGGHRKLGGSLLEEELRDGWSWAVVGTWGDDELEFGGYRGSQGCLGGSVGVVGLVANRGRRTRGWGVEAAT
ncbi:uncharacterized protein A4U43_C04F23540 [Asparagus officinalis]|uniref:Uncharacterized protein n=1 Tax=Asparagus officinalis TaxID=4686 RepID=A0A5P1F5X4_ASPOF|nr:uncharacterized protein A4U43_C04F23540 [Asparagus officinalis]